ncbi:cache domain-containing protein [Candidatus Dependentiae bacterium]|nr:cache domain-containing protein [Candidatus Dependentiae bacterium]MCC7414893.1 cache domain-containing protein [Campylobacterota bacterium]
MKTELRHIGLFVAIIGVGLCAGHTKLYRFFSTNIACNGTETCIDTEAEVIVNNTPDKPLPENNDDDKSDALTTETEEETKAPDAPTAAPADYSKSINSEIADLSTEQFDDKSKSASVVKLVDKGVEFLKKNGTVKAFHTFASNKDFVVGELYLFVFDTQGVCLCHGQDNSLIWKNLWDLKSIYGDLIVQQIIREGLTPSNNGWTSYEWRGATKVSYVKQVTQGDKIYIVGAGYYPHSKSSSVQNLVKSAVELFNFSIKNKQSPTEVFSAMGYPLGRFIQGDLYLYALSFDGVHVAHGDIPGLIGTNGLNYRDANGKLVNQEIIKRLKEKASGGIWVEYMSKNAPKKTYAQKVVDETGKEYFIACGFYPTANRRKVVELVKRGYQYMKGNGKTQAAKMFSRTNDFLYGDLCLAVYDLKGLCIAHGCNPDIVGTSRWDAQDDAGEYYVREMINESQNGPTWIDYKSRNSFKATYVERISLGTDEYIISCGIFPLSKFEKMYLLARSGIDYLKNNQEEKAYESFVDPSSKFCRGDLFVFAIDSNGVCFSYGPEQRDLIWRNLLSMKDDTGKQFVKTIINHTSRGAGTITYTLHGMKYLMYAEPVQKNDSTVIVGSGYFL